MKPVVERVAGPDDRDPEQLKTRVRSHWEQEACGTQYGVFKLIWAVYPRWLVKRLGDRFGLFLLIEAAKPLG